MKKILFIFIMALSVMSLTSCEKKASFKVEFGGGGSDDENGDDVNPNKLIDTEPVKEAKSDYFYEKLLEKFCRDYFKDCFGETYLHNSLSVSYHTNLDPGDVSFVKIYGTHSYEGFITHNGVRFEASVWEKEDNYYHIVFKKYKTTLSGNEAGSEEAERNMYYYE